MALLTALATTLSLGCADIRPGEAQSPPRPEPAPASATRGVMRAKVVSQKAARQQVKTMKIRWKFDEFTLTATLADNATARDFAALLPLTVTLKDYANTEKVTDMPRKLTNAGAPESITPVTGDIGYYAPWGNIALYYKNGPHSPGLVNLGRFDTGVEVLSRPGPLKVTVEQVKE